VSVLCPHVLAVQDPIGMMQNRRKVLHGKPFFAAREGFGSYVDFRADVFDRERSWSAKEY
jgi:hypothetical protein